MCDIVKTFLQSQQFVQNSEQIHSSHFTEVMILYQQLSLTATYELVFSELEYQYFHISNNITQSFNCFTRVTLLRNQNNDICLRRTVNKQLLTETESVFVVEVHLEEINILYVHLRPKVSLLLVPLVPGLLLYVLHILHLI